MHTEIYYKVQDVIGGVTMYIMRLIFRAMINGSEKVGCLLFKDAPISVMVQDNSVWLMAPHVSLEAYTEVKNIKDELTCFEHAQHQLCQEMLSGTNAGCTLIVDRLTNRVAYTSVTSLSIETALTLINNHDYANEWYFTIQDILRITDFGGKKNEHDS